MTVCIAAMCGGGYIIGAADRMLTSGDIQFQPETPKIISITTSIAILISGDASLQAEIVQKVLADVDAGILEEPENGGQWLMLLICTTNTIHERE